MEIAKANQQNFLRFLNEKLAALGIEESLEESERILEDVLETTRTALYAEPHKEISSAATERSFKILEGRKKKIPLAYLLGKKDFWEETLFVAPGCLIPRPETEILVEEVIQAVHKKNHPLAFLDVGTGSGAIAIALLRTFRNSQGTLLDISQDALSIAEKNVVSYELQDRAQLIQSDLFAFFKAGEKWDLIVSNPPYLSDNDFIKIEPELRAEPREALDGGADGLDFYRRLIPEAKEFLKAGGMLALELGAGQCEAVSKWLQEAGYDSIQRSKDYLGVDRVLLARLYPQ